MKTKALINHITSLPYQLGLTGLVVCAIACQSMQSKLSMHGNGEQHPEVATSQPLVLVGDASSVESSTPDPRKTQLELKCAIRTLSQEGASDTVASIIQENPNLASSAIDQLFAKAKADIKEPGYYGGSLSAELTKCSKTLVPLADVEDCLEKLKKTLTNFCQQTQKETGKIWGASLWMQLLREKKANVKEAFPHVLAAICAQRGKSLHDDRYYWPLELMVRHAEDAPQIIESLLAATQCKDQNSDIPLGIAAALYTICNTQLQEAEQPQSSTTSTPKSIQKALKNNLNLRTTLFHGCIAVEKYEQDPKQRTSYSEIDTNLRTALASQHTQYQKQEIQSYVDLYKATTDEKKMSEICRHIVGMAKACPSLAPMATEHLLCDAQKHTAKPSYEKLLIELARLNEQQCKKVFADKFPNTASQLPQETKQQATLRDPFKQWLRAMHTKYQQVMLEYHVALLNEILTDDEPDAKEVKANVSSITEIAQAHPSLVPGAMTKLFQGISDCDKGINEDDDPLPTTCLIPYKNLLLQLININNSSVEQLKKELLRFCKAAESEIGKIWGANLWMHLARGRHASVDEVLPNLLPALRKDRCSIVAKRSYWPTELAICYPQEAEKIINALFNQIHEAEENTPIYYCVSEALYAMTCLVKAEDKTATEMPSYRQTILAAMQKLVQGNSEKYGKVLSDGHNSLHGRSDIVDSSLEGLEDVSAGVVMLPDNRLVKVKRTDPPK